MPWIFEITVTMQIFNMHNYIFTTEVKLWYIKAQILTYPSHEI